MYTVKPLTFQTASSLDLFCADSVALLIIIFHTGPTVTYPDKSQNQKNQMCHKKSNTSERGEFGSVMGGVGWWRRRTNRRAGGVMSQS